MTDISTIKGMMRLDLLVPTPIMMAKSLLLGGGVFSGK